ncbi:MAG: 50S ribosomal protein L29 [Desulfocapsa sp.]|nr:MAG: 50S ribosomal protein L29 [Desulfocapsa sp.]
MKISELRSMSNDDLQKKLVDLKDEISNLTFQHKIRPLENTASIKKLRKDVARINTLFNEN